MSLTFQISPSDISVSDTILTDINLIWHADAPVDKPTPRYFDKVWRDLNHALYVNDGAILPHLYFWSLHKNPMRWKRDFREQTSSLNIHTLGATKSSALTLESCLKQTLNFILAKPLEAPKPKKAKLRPRTCWDHLLGDPLCL